MDMMNGKDTMDRKGWDGGTCSAVQQCKPKQPLPSSQSLKKTKAKKEVVLPKGDKQGSRFIIVHS